MMNRARLLLACLAGAAALLGGCAKAPLASAPRAEREAIEARLTRDIAVLASDEYAGRQPGTDGGRLTVDYLTTRFAEAGLTSGTNDPGNPWRAPVGLTSVRAASSALEIVTGEQSVTLTPAEALAVTTRRRELIAEADMVFVGYEAQDVAIEDVRGKVVVALVDTSLNPERRVILEAKQVGAVIMVTRDPSIIAGVRDDSSRPKIALTGEVEEIFAAIATHEGMARALGQERWSRLVEAATREDFAPLDLEAKANIEANSERRDFTSYNVLGRLAGTRADSEAILLLAHWDHLGECEPASDIDTICNGAVDNASGIALLLELLRRLRAAGPFERDIYALATTAEEVGLLGARAFAANPPIPLSSIVAAFNFDSVAIAPAGSPVGFIGEGRTSLDPVVLEALAAAERELGSREYAARFLERQDAWVLLQEGVPAINLSTAFGSEITSGPYFETRYHSPADEMGALELGGAIDDLLLHEELVKRIAVPAAPAP